MPFDEPTDGSSELDGANDSTPANYDGNFARPIGSFHMDKVHTTLRMFVRDWSSAGALERQQAYEPLLQAVQQYVSLKDRLVLIF